MFSFCRQGGEGGLSDLARCRKVRYAPLAVRPLRSRTASQGALCLDGSLPSPVSHGVTSSVSFAAAIHGLANCAHIKIRRSKADCLLFQYRFVAPPSPHKACALRGPLRCFRRLSFTPLLRLFPTKLRFAGAPKRHLSHRERQGACCADQSNDKRIITHTRGGTRRREATAFYARRSPTPSFVSHRAATARRLGQALHRTLHKRQTVIVGCRGTGF